MREEPQRESAPRTAFPRGCPRRPGFIEPPVQRVNVAVWEPNESILGEPSRSVWTSKFSEGTSRAAACVSAPGVQRRAILGPAMSTPTTSTLPTPDAVERLLDLLPDLERDWNAHCDVLHRLLYETRFVGPLDDCFERGARLRDNPELLATTVDIDELRCCLTLAVRAYRHWGMGSLPRDWMMPSLQRLRELAGGRAPWPWGEGSRPGAARARRCRRFAARMNKRV